MNIKSNYSFAQKAKIFVFNKTFNITDVKSKIMVRNAFYSFFIKGINIGLSFLTIPIVLSFLSTTQYGIWLTLTAVLSWFSLFDLGFGNGLRNHLTIALSKDDFTEGKIYVSTTYAALSAIFGSLILLFLFLHPFIDWTKVFNAPSNLSNDVNSAVFFAIVFLLLQFVVRLINIILLSVQKSAMADFSNVVAQFFILAGLYLLKALDFHSLTAVAVLYSIIPIITFTIFSIIFFTGKYSIISPSFRFVRKKHVSSLLKLGLNFFIIQIVAIVLYASDNFIIAQLFTPSDVTIYNISFKYFSIITVLFTIILTPFWSMTTSAFVQGDLIWIKATIKKLLFIWVGLIAVGIVLLLLSDYAYAILTHYKVKVPLQLSVTIFAYTIITSFGAIFSNFLNAIGKIKLQIYIAVVSMFINIPLAICFVKIFKLGLMGVPLATSCTVLAVMPVIYIQYRKIVSNTAFGIWDK